LKKFDKAVEIIICGGDVSEFSYLDDELCPKDKDPFYLELKWLYHISQQLIEEKIQEKNTQSLLKGGVKTLFQPDNVYWQKNYFQEILRTRFVMLQILHDKANWKQPRS